MTRWEVLAALQALSIYIIIRLDEGQTEHNDFDFLLLASVMVSWSPVLQSYLTGSNKLEKALSKRFGQVSSETPFELRGLKENWQDWVFEESTRRLVPIS
jgi:hypothetical protein